MTYQSKSDKLLKSPYRFTHKITATESKTVEYDNGSTGTEQVETWSRKAALYATSLTSTAGIEGYNAKIMFQLAVRKTANDIFDSFSFDTSMIIHLDNDKNTKYTIENIQRSTQPFGVHILTLAKHSDGSDSTSSSDSDDSSDSDSSDSGDYGY